MPRPETIELWRQRIERFDAADMTVAQFCQSEGVSQPSFYQWKRTIRQIAQQAESPAVSFRPLCLTAPAINDTPSDASSSQPVPVAPRIASTTVELPGGIRIRVEVPTDTVATPLGAALDEETPA